MWIIHFLKIFQGLNTTETCQQCTEFARFLTMYITHVLLSMKSLAGYTIYMRSCIYLSQICNLVYQSSVVIVYIQGFWPQVVDTKTVVMSKLTMCPANPTPLPNLYCIGCTLWARGTTSSIPVPFIIWRTPPLPFVAWFSPRTLQIVHVSLCQSPLLYFPPLASRIPKSL
jgi:hypothetical protein